MTTYGCAKRYILPPQGYQKNEAKLFASHPGENQTAEEQVLGWFHSILQTAAAKRTRSNTKSHRVHISPTMTCKGTRKILSRGFINLKRSLGHLRSTRGQKGSDNLINSCTWLAFAELTRSAPFQGQTIANVISPHFGKKTTSRFLWLVSLSALKLPWSHAGESNIKEMGREISHFPTNFE